MMASGAGKGQKEGGPGVFDRRGGGPHRISRDFKGRLRAALPHPYIPPPPSISLA